LIYCAWLRLGYFEQYPIIHHLEPADGSGVRPFLAVDTKLVEKSFSGVASVLACRQSVPSGHAPDGCWFIVDETAAQKVLAGQFPASFFAQFLF